MLSPQICANGMHIACLPVLSRQSPAEQLPPGGVQPAAHGWVPVGHAVLADATYIVKIKNIAAYRLLSHR
jgi:hypothetical protein